MPELSVSKSRKMKQEDTSDFTRSTSLVEPVDNEPRKGDILEFEEFNRIDFANDCTMIKTEVEREGEQAKKYNIKHEPLEYTIIKTEVEGKEEYNIKFEPLEYDFGDMKEEVKEEVDEQHDINDIKYKPLDYEIISPIENAGQEAQKQFECDKCNYKTNYKNHLYRHIICIHEREKATFYACKLCSFKTIHKESLKKHIKYRHEKNEKQFQCPKCDHKSKRKSDLERHILNIHEKEKLPRYACELCSYQTICMGTLNQHIAYMHEKNGEEFECSKCDFKSRCKGNLKKHIVSIHLKEKSPVYTCELCPYQTVDKGNLRKHTKTHSGEIFAKECTICQTIFRRKRSLDAHYVSRHSDQSDSFKHLLTNKVNQCPKCPYATIRPSNLKNHLKVHDNRDESIFKFSCDICGYKCKLKSNLKKHLRVHADQLSFACTECSDMRFKEKHQLDGHIVSRHRENEALMKTVTSRIHRCPNPQCYYKVVKESDMKNHLKYCKDLI